MADLADKTKIILNHIDAFKPDYGKILENMEKLKSIIEGVENEDQLHAAMMSKITEEEIMDYEAVFMVLEAQKFASKEGTKEFFNELAKRLEAASRIIKSGELDAHPWLKKVLDEYEFDLQALWIRFAAVSRRLESIAHKQLRKKALNDSEKEFIKSYSETLAGIMLYGGNAYLTPRDDAPRVVDVFANPEQGGYLHVGVGRPRTLFVLYPWQDKTVLCQGAVMPYYEFVEPARLDDRMWKEKLDSDKRPAVENWLSPFVSGKNLGKPLLKDE
jgi:hypothetical protein